MARTRIQEVAEERGWNASRLGRAADISQAAMYALWHGRVKDPGLQTLAALARVLGVRVADLIEEDEGAEGDRNAPALAAA